MARPIKDTPTLKGKEAKKFLKKFEKVSDVKIPPAQIAKMKENFSAMLSIAQFK